MATGGDGLSDAKGAPGYDALLGLLIYLPGIVGLVQVGLWQLYPLHGAQLKEVKAQIQQLEQEQSGVIETLL
jgi:Na+/melibiose symporter-like transporter